MASLWGATDILDDFIETVFECSHHGLWIRNFQLAIVGFPIALLTALVQYLNSDPQHEVSLDDSPMVISGTIMIWQIFGGFTLATVINKAASPIFIVSCVLQMISLVSN